MASNQAMQRTADGQFVARAFAVATSGQGVAPCELASALALAAWRMPDVPGVAAR